MSLYGDKEVGRVEEVMKETTRKLKRFGGGRRRGRKGGGKEGGGEEGGERGGNLFFYLLLHSSIIQLSSTHPLILFYHSI